MNADNLKKITELRHKLHMHPHLSGHEEPTKKMLMKFLEDNTSLAVVDCGIWFYASRYVEGTDAIAFRADFDALPIHETLNIPYASVMPGVSHKCGHDGHAAALCGLALELDSMQCGRSVYLIFQPAEEIGRGGLPCSMMLKERSVTEVYAFHNMSGMPENSVAVRKGLCNCASMGLTVKMKGSGSHASEPENGHSPAFPIVLLGAHISEMLNRPRNCLMMCTIVHIGVGNRDFGISPADGEMSMTLRSDSEPEIEKFAHEVREKASELAGEAGVKAEFIISDAFPETVSDANCVDRVEETAKALGREVIRMENPIRGSEDFGWYTKQCPGAIFYIGNGNDHPAVHTPEYDFNDNILETAVDIFINIYNGK